MTFELRASAETRDMQEMKHIEKNRSRKESRASRETPTRESQMKTYRFSLAAFPPEHILVLCLLRGETTASGSKSLRDVPANSQSQRRRQKDKR